MTDTRTSEQRTAIMRSVRSKDTGPELKVRRLAHRLGYRFRLHVKTLPGKPDIVFPRLNKIILVHGCFWHGHGCKYGKLPKSRQDFWEPKIAANRSRDRRTIKALRSLGWDVKIIWQCQTKDLKKLENRVATFLERKSDRHRKSKSLSCTKIS
ncbi:MAG: very short patch repair endonuclease [Alphaproteobacteria bacterium HGW-Alphaproteobacteria-12]|nr:MAG: very short patch repair endonuclease [Alphaproteobacteria bacterium HGW-Alphaproteobacteria-12]